MFVSQLSYCEEALSSSIQPSGFFYRLRAWLSVAEPPRSVDLLFVLAGRMHRKDFALQLLADGLSPRVLFSVGRFEIRRFSKMPLPVPLDLLKIAQALPPPQRHYFAYFHSQEVQHKHVPPGRFGTLTEIRALAEWLIQQPEICSVAIVSSSIHLRRIRLCCRTLLNPKLELSFLAAPLSLETTASSPIPEQDAEIVSAGDVIAELCKLAIYWVLFKFH